MRQLTLHGKAIDNLYNRNQQLRKRHVEEKVRKIIEHVRDEGDQAVVKYTKKFDKAVLTPRELRVPEAEISGAYQNITKEFIAELKGIIQNVTEYYKTQLKKPAKLTSADGVILAEQFRPIDSVGVYIPAGTAPLVSSVYMTVIPARVAGVKRIVMAVPPDKDGQVNPYVLAVANLLKVDEVYKMGGSQAIAALALGTRHVPKVDKIVGPGNSYVTEAKRQLFGYVDIDMLAGPTELVVIANRNSNPDFVVADLEAQMEHLGGLSILVTTSKRLIKYVKKRIKNANGYCIYVKNMDEAIEIANRIAPEHLQICTENARSLAKKINHAGAIFLGQYSPTALGDYYAGPSHVLPTMGTARFFSGLCLYSFMKTSHVISYTKKALERARGPIEMVAHMEGLTKHAESISIRFE